MHIGLSCIQSLALTQECICISRPNENWSLLNAFDHADNDRCPEIPIKIRKVKLDTFGAVSYEELMKRIDEYNHVFRYDYVKGPKKGPGKGYYYFKIPLLRDRNVDVNDIKMFISQDNYERAKAILDNVGAMDRIARAIPYYKLLTVIRKHLWKKYRVSLSDVVLVGIDRGGRLPAIILSRALDVSDIHFLKLDQGCGELDEKRLNGFRTQGLFRDKHVLFVDSTVDSGRQIDVLRRYFDDSEWQRGLGFLSWSVVGSNENGECLDKHLNIDWGVNPDETFEDDPRLMGVDYAPGSQTSVIEVPSEASEKIREALLSVPDGLVYEFPDVDKRVTEHLQRKKEVEKKELLYSTVSTALRRITDTRAWQKAALQSPTVSFDSLPMSLPNGDSHAKKNILIIGSGKNADMSDNASSLISKTLGSYHSILVGTLKGNPGKVLRSAIDQSERPEIHLYQPSYREDEVGKTIGGTPVTFVGPKKQHMRVKMVEDADIVLVLGGGEGTLRETLLALRLQKPVVLIRGWGAVPAYLLTSKSPRYSQSPHIIACDGVVEAVQSIMNMTRV